MSGQSATGARFRTRRGGFTLMELVVAMAITSVLLGSISAAMFITVQAVPDGKSAADVVLSEFNALEQMTSELAYALHFTERSATAVAFTVADRDGDGVPERIRYAWSGSAGDSLTRAYNGGTAAEVLADVGEFDLGYQLKQVTEEYPGPLVESAEVLFSNAGAPYHSHSFNVTDTDWAGQVFLPILPVDALHWRVTRVVFSARVGADPDLYRVQLRTVGASNHPTDTIVDEVTADSSGMSSSWHWEEYSFNNAANLTPGDDLCYLVVAVDNDEPIDLHRDDHIGAGYVKTTDTGASWTYRADRRFFHYIYGTYTTPGPPQNAVRNYVTAVSVALRSGDDAASRLMTTVQTLNCPEALSALWETDFDIDPLVDLNGDGQVDWTVGSGSHDANSISNGIWDADARLDTSPDSDFANLTTALVRFRDTSTGSGGVVFRINANHTGTTVSPIVAKLTLQSDLTQTLTISGIDDAGSVILDTRTGLDSEFVTVRLLIDPALDTLCLTVNSAHVGTYDYPSRNAGGTNRIAILNRSPTVSEFDYVSIRVSE